MFTQAWSQSYSCDEGCYLWSASPGDFNGDGVPDLAVVEGEGEGNDNVQILLGVGDGTFVAGTTIGSSVEGQVAVGDFNRDGNLDLAVLNYAGSGASVIIFVGRGDGGFSDGGEFGTDYSPSSIAVGDFNGDGKLDLVVSSSYYHNLSVLMGKGDGTFEKKADYPYGARAELMGDLVVGDFNEDGKLDVAVGSTDGLRVLLGFGDGGFGAPRVFSTNPALIAGLAAADLNGDGHLDLVAVTGQGTSQLEVLMGYGDGGFADPVVYETFADPGTVSIGDFNGDGVPDVAVGGAAPAVFLGAGDGSLEAPFSIEVDTADTFELALADFNRDGKPDLLMLGTFPNRQDFTMLDGSEISVQLNTGSYVAAGLFGPHPLSFDAGSEPIAVAIADVNGDGNPDLIVADGIGFDSSPVRSVNVLLGRGDGTFAPPLPAAPTDIPNSLAVADLNADGHLDVVTGNNNLSSVSVMLGKGDGTFGLATSWPTDEPPSSVLIGDFNGDGHPDIVSVGEEASSSNGSDLPGRPSQEADPDELEPWRSLPDQTGGRDESGSRRRNRRLRQPSG